jgi:hypothetical protein
MREKRGGPLSSKQGGAGAHPGHERPLCRLPLFFYAPAFPTPPAPAAGILFYAACVGVGSDINGTTGLRSCVVILSKR